MKRQVIVVGLGRFGTSVATTLFKRGHEVMAIDHDERRVQEVVSQVTYAVQADATNEVSLKELGVSNFDLGVVAAGKDIQANILATVLLQRLGIRQVVARAQNDLHALTLEKIGASPVVHPEREAGERLAHNLSFPDVQEYMELSPGFGISKINAPEWCVGKTLEEADLGPRSKTGLTMLMVKRAHDVIINPDRFERIQRDDILVVTGKDEHLEKFERAGNGSARTVTRP